MEEVIEAVDTFELQSQSTKRPLKNRRFALSLGAIGIVVLGGALYWNHSINGRLADTSASAVLTSTLGTPQQPTDPEQMQKQTAIQLGIPLYRTGPEDMKFLLIPPGDFLMGYCDWLNKKSEVESPETKIPANGVRYYLPTEAQWEYACRAGSDSRWSHGNDEQQLSEYAWYMQNSNWVFHSVAKKRPNAWGFTICMAMSPSGVLIGSKETPVTTIHTQR